MAGFNFGNITQALNEASATNGVSFEGKANKWGSKEDAREVIEAIEACANLEYLNLEGNTLGVDAAEGIAAALERHPELKRALWKDLFTGRMKTEIPLALQSMGRSMQTAGTQLTILDCSDNALGPNGMRGLVDLLKSPTCFSLKELKLNNCGLGIEGGRMLAKSLTECLNASVQANQHFQLRVFVAGRNRLENDGARALADIFGQLGSLEEVSMPQNGINPDGIRALADAFKCNESLRVLNLNDNTITPRGANALANAIELLLQLREINLGDCLLKTGGATQLAAALDSHAQLEVLNVGFNEIGPAGGVRVAEAMLNKPNIKTIVLNGNMFGEQHRERISEMLDNAGLLEALGELDEDDSDNEDADKDDGGGEDEQDDDDDAYGEEYDDDEDYEDVDEEEDDDDEDDEDDGDEDGGGACDISPHVSSSTATKFGFGRSTAATTTTSSSADKSLNFSFNLNSAGSGHNDTTLGAGDASLNISGFSNGADLSVVTGDTPVETFCLTAHPTTAMFADIEEADKVVAFRDYLESLHDADYLLHAVFAVLKCSAISILSPAALTVATELYRDCFVHATTTGQLVRVKSFFLKQLGLLRVEDLSFKPAYDVIACRAAVKHAIAERVLPDEVSSAFELFLERF